jgi:predicted RNA-binding Zn ribbon-like protein
MTALTVPVASDAARRPSAPGDLELIRQFVNTHDVETGWDGLDNPAALQAWLVERGLLPVGRRLTAADIATAVAFREILRQVLAANAGHGDRATALRHLDGLAGRYPLRVRLAGSPRLEPDGGTGVAPAIAGLLAVMYDAMAHETWDRLKICRNDECQWAFYDQSRNHSGTWCSMAICGNRMKGRAFRERRAGSAPA